MDDFDQFVFHDAVTRCGLSTRDAWGRVDHYSSWIHHAIVRLGYAEGDDELRAAQQEIEQDIRNVQTRHGWDGQLMAAFRRRWEAAPGRTAGSSRLARLSVQRPRLDSLNR